MSHSIFILVSYLPLLVSKCCRCCCCRWWRLFFFFFSLSLYIYISLSLWMCLLCTSLSVLRLVFSIFLSPFSLSIYIYIYIYISACLLLRVVCMQECAQMCMHGLRERAWVGECLSVRANALVYLLSECCPGYHSLSTLGSWLLTPSC